MRRRGLFRLHHDQEGVTAIIVALCLIALFGMLVLVVDVGGLLWKRREMVSGADAAALAAAKTCAVPAVTDPSDPKAQANTEAISNVGGLTASNMSDWQTSGCTAAVRTPSGYVTVQYSYPQQLFFAGIFGASSKTVTTAATAAWGPLGAGNAVPIVLDQGVLQGPSCDVPDLQPGQTCAFWYNDKDPFGSSDWGFLNLDLWDVPKDLGACPPAGGTKTVGDYILNNFGTPLPLADPGPTYVCSVPGHRDVNWDKALQDRLDGLGCKTSPCPGPVLLMPVNDCSQAVDAGGTAVGCGDPKVLKYAIVGFATLQLTGIYAGNTTAAVGTPAVQGPSGDCGNGKALGASGSGDSTLDITRQFGGWYLPTFAASFCGAPTTADGITAPVTVDPQGGSSPPLVPCTSVPSTSSGPAPSPTNCDYYYNPTSKTLSWWDSTSKDVQNKVRFGWSINGTPPTPGFCSPHTSDPNAVCLVMTWKGYTDQNGTVGTGPEFGTQGHVLCDFTYNSCPAGIKP